MVIVKRDKTRFMEVKEKEFDLLRTLLNQIAGKSKSDMDKVSSEFSDACSNFYDKWSDVRDQ